MPRILPTLLHSILLLTLLCLAGAAQAQAERRVAFVMGNEAYVSGDLPRLSNPARDVETMARALESVGFELWPKGRRVDLRLEEMETELSRFREAAQGAEIGLIYFAGHGMQDGGKNYFFPINAEPNTLAALPRHAFTLSEMMDSMSGVTKLRIGLFDACRDNRLVEALRRREGAATRSAQAGLGMAKVDLGRGRGMEHADSQLRSLVMFPTKPGETTADGAPGTNSPFVASLTQRLAADLEIRRLFGHVVDDVAQATGHRQRPEVVTDMGGEDLRLAIRARAGQEIPASPSAPQPVPNAVAAAPVPAPNLAQTEPIPPESSSPRAVAPKSSLALRFESVNPIGDFSPDGSRIIAGSANTGLLKLFDAKTGAETSPSVVLPHQNGARGVLFSADGARFLTVSGLEAIVWNSWGGEDHRITHRQNDWVTAARLSADQSRLATGARFGGLTIWDLQTEQPLRVLQESQPGSVSALGFDPEGRRLVSGSEGGVFNIWDVETGGKIFETKRDSGVISARFSPDGQRVLVGFADGLLQIWDARSHELLSQRRYGAGGVARLTASPDETLVLTAAGGMVQIWDRRTGRRLSEVEVARNRLVSVLAFSPDGRRFLAGANHNYALKVWDLFE